MRSQTVARLYPCIFIGAHIRKVTDPEVKRLFDEAGKKAPWGDLRNQWRQEHCATLNPYASEDCPYTKWVCEMAYLDTIRDALATSPDSFMGMFRKMARSKGAQRADDAQRSRHAERVRRSRGQGHPGQVRELSHAVQGGQHESGAAEGSTGLLDSSQEQPVRRPDRGPARLGTLLGSPDPGSRPSPRRRDEGQAGS